MPIKKYPIYFDSSGTSLYRSCLTGQLFVVPSRWEVNPDLPFIRLPIGSQLSPVARGEADFNEWHTVTVEVYNPDNNALLYRHSEPVDSGGILLPLGIIRGYCDCKLSREVVRDTDKGFATPCTGIAPVTFGYCRRSHCADGHVFMVMKCGRVRGEVDHGLSKENVSAHIFLQLLVHTCTRVYLVVKS